MCCSCSQVYVPSKELVLATKDNFEECFKHIFVRFAGDTPYDWDMEAVKRIQLNARRNFTEFMQQYYLYKLENPEINYPFDIAYPDHVVETNHSQEPQTLIEHLLWCSYVAHRNLSKVIHNYVVELEDQKEKKRQRRLRHKKNIREKKLTAIQNGQ
jgi:hypothetical protein